MTAVHRPLDARIHGRQIAALLAAGDEVTYVAPWRDTGTTPPDTPGLVPLDVRRAEGRRRLAAWRDVRRVVADRADDHDVVLVHDPELLVAIAGLRELPPVVWDVHEDTAAALVDRPWVPGSLRPLLSSAVRAVERRAERRHHLLLAEAGYVTRFRGDHPVVRNLPHRVADAPATPSADRVVYLGRLSSSRGLDMMLELAEALHDDGATLELIGYADPGVEHRVRRAHDAGLVRWAGFVPNHQALERLRGAGVGLSLLRDSPNFRVSLPTKVAEYMAHGVPVVTTPLPEASRLVEESGGGRVVPFDDLDAVVVATRSLLADDGARTAMGAAGHAYASRQLRWDREAEHFVAHLHRWARS